MSRGAAPVLQLAKSAKHQLMLAGRRLPLDRPRQVRDRAYRTLTRVRPYSYRDHHFPRSFVAQSPKVHQATAHPVPGHFFALWTGDNAMSANRAGALADMRSRLDVTLVTPANLDQWVLAGSPLHPAYEHLSLVHRSDYLRAYLMHHHGGAYLDVKRGYGDVAAAVRRLDADDQAWMVGFRELGASTVSQEKSPTRSALRRHHALLIGMGAFAARPATPLTAEWLAEVHSRLDRYAGELERHPGDALGRNEGYPIPWTGILGDVLQPLCLKYAERLLMDARIKPSFVDYR